VHHYLRLQVPPSDDKERGATLARLDEMLLGPPVITTDAPTTTAAGRPVDRRGIPMPSWWPGALEAARSSTAAMTEIKIPGR